MVCFVCVFVCVSMFPHHNSKLLGLSQVIIFILHLSQDAQLLLCRQVFDEILSGNKRKMWKIYMTNRIWTHLC